MEQGALAQFIQNTILSCFAKKGMYFFPVAVSARHVHLSKNDFEKLFGAGKRMTLYKDLSQPGQFACEETVEIIGPRNTIKKVRVLGPERKETQVEISMSDSYTLGIKPEIRMSGNIDNTPGCTLIGPAGTITINRGVIVASRHIHLSEEQAHIYGVKNGDHVSLKTPSPREGILGNIAVRVGKDFDLEVHLDTDEANGNAIRNGTILEASGLGASGSAPRPAAGILPGFYSNSSDAALDLITESDINKALIRGEKIIYCTAKGFISPAARDRAKEKGITLCKLQG